MKTREEILNFYGVEIGKTYKITDINLMVSGAKIFTVKEIGYCLGGLGLEFEDGFVRAISMLNECYYEEYNSILDDEEREYLQKYVMDNPAFKGRVLSITKFTHSKEKKEYLAIRLNSDTIYMPFFRQNTMYKKMKKEKQYTPKELGLEE